MRGTKCNEVFHMGNHVAIPSNQIGNRCEDGAVIEVRRVYADVKGNRRGSRDTAASLERHSTFSHSIYVASCLSNTPRTAVLDDGSSATLR
ncbi:unnamed protein product [Lasius platythorax]|uniref:Uncharacterized protein n=1 Tax=Lasius platythorax TaxID=488582 RepID=A0AAV2N670_9HYME